MDRTLSPDEIAAKKERRAQQAEKNAVDYREQQRATLDKTARLRALRLAEKPKRDKPRRDAAKPKKGGGRGPIPGLYQGGRG